MLPASILAWVLAARLPVSLFRSLLLMFNSPATIWPLWLLISPLWRLIWLAEMPPLCLVWLLFNCCPAVSMLICALAAIKPCWLSTSPLWSSMLCPATIWPPKLFSCCWLVSSSTLPLAWICPCWLLILPDWMDRSVWLMTLPEALLKACLLVSMVIKSPLIVPCSLLSPWALMSTAFAACKLPEVLLMAPCWASMFNCSLIDATSPSWLFKPWLWIFTAWLALMLPCWLFNQPSLLRLNSPLVAISPCWLSPCAMLKLMLSPLLMLPWVLEKSWVRMSVVVLTFNWPARLLKRSVSLSKRLKFNSPWSLSNCLPLTCKLPSVIWPWLLKPSVALKLTSPLAMIWPASLVNCLLTSMWPSAKTTGVDGLVVNATLPPPAAVLGVCCAVWPLWPPVWEPWLDEVPSGNAPITPLFRLLKVPALKVSFCEPVWLMTPCWLSKLPVWMSKRLALMSPLLRKWLWLRRFNSFELAIKPLLLKFLVWSWAFPWEESVPLLVTSVALMVTLAWSACWASLSDTIKLPLLVSWPLASMLTPPALAKIWPALFTPTPLSVLIKVILPAYIPPNWPTSMPHCKGCPLLASVAVTAPLAATSLLPTVTSSFLAQMPPCNWEAWLIKRV